MLILISVTELSDSEFLLQDHREPGFLPAGPVPPVSDVRLRDPEHGARDHLRASGGPEAGAGGPGPAARGGEGGGHGGERGRRHGDHALQGPAALRRAQPARAGLPDLDLRQPHLQLDAGVRLHPRPLPLLVRLDGPPGARAEAVPGEAVRHLAHLRLWPAPVPGHRRLHRGGPQQVEGELRRGALHHPLRCKHLNRHN